MASGTILTKFTYSYADAAFVDRDLRQSVTDKDGNKTSYTYDPLNRLTRAQTKNSGGSVTATYDYTYDGNSNRTSQVVNGQATNYSSNNVSGAAATTTFSTALAP